MATTISRSKRAMRVGTGIVITTFALGFAGVSYAYANSNPTTDLLWQMPKGATAKNPQWPQNLAKTIECGYVGQHDVYQTYKDDKFDKSPKDRLDAYIKDITADGKLTWSHGVSEDSEKAAKYGVKIISWDFVDGKCETPKPTKTTETPKPTVTVTTPKPTVTVTTPKPTETTTTPTGASFNSRTCTTGTVKTNVVKEIQVIASAKVNGVALPAPTYGSVDGMNTITFTGVPETAFTLEVTLTEENSDAVKVTINFPAAEGCTTTTPTTPATQPTTPTTVKTTTKATAEVISTKRPGIGG